IHGSALKKRWGGAPPENLSYPPPRPHLRIYNSRLHVIPIHQSEKKKKINTPPIKPKKKNPTKKTLITKKKKKKKKKQQKKKKKKKP
ncbi:hypothetical protein, partial [Enterobacter sichuanensis]